MILKLVCTKVEQPDHAYRLWTNIEDFYMMLDGVSAAVLADYLRYRMKPKFEEKQQQKGGGE